jgi:ABC-type glycerol-3-phosphate transport system permease component
MAAPQGPLPAAYDPKRLRLAHVPAWLFGSLVALVWAMPFLWMISTSFKRPEHVMTQEIEWIPRVFTLDNYTKVFEYPILRWAFNSLVQACVSTALCVLFGAMAGYALARLRFPGNGLLFAVFIASLMIPAEVTVVPLLLAVIKAGWASTYAALIIPTIANVFSVYIFRQYFLTFPQELEDAARMDGAGPFRTFFLIALPMARAPAVAATVVIFTLNWNNFLWPLLVTFREDMKTLPVGVAQFAPVVGTHTQLEGFSVSMAAVTVLAVPSVIVFLLLQRYFIEGLSQGSVKS